MKVKGRTENSHLAEGRSRRPCPRHPPHPRPHRLHRTARETVK